MTAVSYCLSGVVVAAAVVGGAVTADGEYTVLAQSGGYGPYLAEGGEAGSGVTVYGTGGGGLAHFH